METISVSHFRMIDDFHLKAVASILINNELAVHDIKLVQQSPNRLIVNMPYKQDGQGIYRDVVHPVRQELRQQIDDLLLSEYKKRRPAE
ncbi:MAG: SpoVG family protein [Angelakisella sp.]